MKKIVSTIAILLSIVLQLTAQIEGNPRYLRVEQPTDIFKINVEQGIPYYVKTEMINGDSLKVVVYKNREVIATYPADTKIYPIYQNNATLAANSILVDENKNLILINTEDSLLVFNSTNPNQFQIGEILVGGISEVSPDGYLRKVVSQEVVNGKLIVYTTPAGLDEAFDEISINEIIDFSEVIDAQSILENNPQLRSDESEYDFGKGSINLSFKKEINKYITVSLAFKGNVKLDFEYEKRSGLMPEKAKLVTYLYVENATSTTIGGKINIKEWNLGKIKLPTVKFHVLIAGAPFPIILENQMLFTVDASVDVGTKVSGGIFGSANTKVGIEYYNGKISPISGLETQMDVDGPLLLEPVFKGGISGKVEFQTLPYGIEILKGYTSVSWGPEITIQTDHPQWRVTSQWGLKAGFKTKFLGIDGDLNAKYDFPEKLIAEGSFITGLPNIFSYPAEDVNTNSAKLMGHVREDNGSAVSERGFYWGNSLGNMNNKEVVGNGIGEYSKTITGLRNGETYYYRTYAINGKGIKYGELINFTCAGLPYDLYPRVNETWNVTDNSVEVSGNIGISGLKMIMPSEYGFVWATSYFSPQTNIDTYPNKLSLNPVEDIPPFGKDIQGTITGLIPNTEYTIIAYVKSGGKTFYGGHKKIKTQNSSQSPVQITSGNPYEISLTSAKIDININSAQSVTNRGVCYSMMASTPTLEDGTTIVSGGGTGAFTATLAGLWENVYYYVRPYAVVAGKAYYGETKMFLTSIESQEISTVCDNPIETGNTGASKEISYTFCEEGLMIVDGEGTMSGTISGVSHWQDSWFKDSVRCLIVNDGFTNIGYHSFSRFENLKTVSLSSTISSIGGYAFSACYKLESINIPDGLISIGNAALRDCRLLTQLNLPSSIASIGSRAFESCRNLKSINIPNGVTSIEEHTFSNCQSLSSISIANTVTSIGSEAFWYCLSLTSIALPNSLKSIESSAFGNSSLISIDIPENVTDIKASAFYHCKDLEKIIIPNSVTSIEDNAFSYCTGLKEVTVKWEQPLDVLEPFGGNSTPISSVVLKVPIGTKWLYEKAAVWKDFGQIVEYTP